MQADIPLGVYVEAARARNTLWGYDRTLDPDHFERVVAEAAVEPALRLVVEVAYIAGRARTVPVEKLVRDRIPHIIAATGTTATTRIAGDAEYRRLLRAKLVEEVDEYLGGGGDPAELVDILEVVLALAHVHSIGRDRLEDLRLAKRAERGGFDGRIVWSGNESRP